jgi:signal transduction histidine kinase
MMRRRTLRGRVSLLALAVIAGWLAVLAVTFNVILARRLDSQVNSTLRIRAQAASATVVISPAGSVIVRDSATDSDLDSKIWIYSGHRAVERPAGTAAIQKAADALAGTGPRYRAVSGDARLYALPVRHGGRQIATVVAGVSTGPYHRAEGAALIGSALVSLLIVAGAYPVLRIAASRALRPVDKMTRQAAEWSARAPSERFGAGQQFEELQALAGTLDALLDRLSAVLRHERRLSAELSHELRTPLSHIAAEVDLMLSVRHNPADEKAAHLRIRDRADSMDRIIETLLSTARAEQRDHPAGACAVDTVIASIAARIDATFACRYDPSALAVGVDGAVLERILAPIMENAGRYARSTIWVETIRRTGEVVIDISNDGPLLEPQFAERVFEPGFRADESDHNAGVGLGLALARRLARSADGDVAVLTAAEVTTFRITLQPA